MTAFDLWASFNDGATWTKVPVLTSSPGHYTALVPNPTNAAGRTVSLRVHASDSGGSSIEQTIIGAYGLQ